MTRDDTISLLCTGRFLAGAALYHFFNHTLQASASCVSRKTAHASPAGPWSLGSKAAHRLYPALFSHVLSGSIVSRCSQSILIVIPLYSLLFLIIPFVGVSAVRSCHVAFCDP